MSRFDRRMRGLRPGESTKGRKTNIPTQKPNLIQSQTMSQPQTQQQSFQSTSVLQARASSLNALSMSDDKNTRIMSSHEIRLNEIDEKFNQLEKAIAMNNSKYDTILNNYENHIKALFGNINKFNSIIEGFRRFEVIVNETNSRCDILDKKCEKVELFNKELSKINADISSLKMKWDNVKDEINLEDEKMANIDTDLLKKNIEEKLNKMGNVNSEETETETETETSGAFDKAVEVSRPIDSVIEEIKNVEELAKSESKDILNRIDEKINNNNINVEIIENDEDDGTTDLDDIKMLVSSTLQSKMGNDEEISQEA